MCWGESVVRMGRSDGRREQSCEGERDGKVGGRREGEMVRIL